VNQIPAKTRALTPKQEAFARAVLTEDSYSDAYRKAYAPKKMSDVAINTEATRLMKHPLISLRVAELRKAVADVAVMKKQELLERMTSLARVSASDLFDNHGNPIDVCSLAPGVRDLIAGFEWCEEFEGKGESRVCVGYIKKYKLVDKLSIYREIAKMIGVYGVEDEAPKTVGGNTFIGGQHVHLTPQDAYTQMVRGA
jgi:hypothetical protein